MNLPHPISWYDSTPRAYYFAALKSKPTKSEHTPQWVLQLFEPNTNLNPEGLEVLDFLEKTIIPKVVNGRFSLQVDIFLALAAGKYISRSWVQ